MKVSLGFCDFYVILEARCHPLLFRDGFLDSCVATSFRFTDAGVAFHLRRGRREGRDGEEEKRGKRERRRREGGGREG